MIPAADIAAARDRIPLAELVGRTLPLKRSGAYWMGCCPFHDDSTPSFAIRDNRWRCYAGCGGGDAIEFIRRLRGLDFAEAVRELLGMPAAAPAAAALVRRQTVDRTSQDIDRVREIWRESGPVVSGTAAFIYLFSRGLDTRQPALRAHPGLYVAETGERLPALIAPVRDSAGHLVALQRVWCQERIETVNGEGPADSRARLRMRKKTLGAMGGGCVRLAAAGPVLGLAEGVETAIAASMLYRLPVWAVCGSARLATVWLPREIETLYIFGDNGKVGQEMADKAVDAHSGYRYVEAVFPDERFGDFADQLIGRVAP